MSNFIQIHMLTSYPPSNLNRDDTGRPKSATIGGVTRLRISSQSLKRAWRTSEKFKESLSHHLGTRTKEMGREVYMNLIDRKVDHVKALRWAKVIASQFGKLKTLSATERAELNDLEQEERKQKELIEVDIEQLTHFSVEEKNAIDELAEKLAKREEDPTREELDLLRQENSAADIAMFGRMLADSPKFNVEAAVQVAHAFTVHRVDVEDDYFTAVDDLNKGIEDVGAAHIGETEFGAGVFYKYICINKDLLIENLNGDEALAKKTLGALLEAAATVAPTGKQNSFASRAWASFIRCEKGTQQPRSLSVAFLKPIRGENFLPDAMEAIRTAAESMHRAYGGCHDDSIEFDVSDDTSSFDDLKTFVTE